MYRIKIAITSAKLILSNSLIVRLTLCHLWMVGRLFFIKNTDIFVFAQRLLFCIQKISWFGFFPYPFVFEIFGLTQNQFSGKQTLRGKDDGSIGFDNSPILLPKKIQRNITVPLILCHAIWKITQDHVNGCFWYAFHAFQTIFFKKRVYHRINMGIAVNHTMRNLLLFILKFQNIIYFAIQSNTNFFDAFK